MTKRKGTPGRRVKAVVEPRVTVRSYRPSSSRMVGVLYDRVPEEEKAACAFPHKNRRPGSGGTMGFS